jgi:hypothetical protein
MSQEITTTDDIYSVNWIIESTPFALKQKADEALAKVKFNLAKDSVEVRFLDKHNSVITFTQNQYNRIREKCVKEEDFDKVVYKMFKLKDQ